MGALGRMLQCPRQRNIIVFISWPVCGQSVYSADESRYSQMWVAIFCRITGCCGTGNDTQTGYWFFDHQLRPSRHPWGWYVVPCHNRCWSHRDETQPYNQIIYVLDPFQPLNNQSISLCRYAQDISYVPDGGTKYRKSKHSTDFDMRIGTFI